MAQTLKEAALTTRNARAALSVGVHWRGIDPDTHLGYRKGKRGGRWFVRWYVGHGKYTQVTVATADDSIGEGNLSFDAAVKASREIVIAARREAAAKAAGPVSTVRSALESYIVQRDIRVTARAGRQTRSDAASRLSLHVLSNEALASTPLKDLTEEQLSKWRSALSGKVSTKRRLASDFRAALNAAGSRERKTLPSDFLAIVAHGLKPSETEISGPPEPVARENQILADDKVRALVRAADLVDAEQSWDGDLARMVLLLASTGARFSQLTRLRVDDVQATRLLIPTSRKGRARDETRTPVPVAPDVIEALQPAVRGRKGHEILLERWFHTACGKGKWRRDRRAPWGAAYEITKIFRTVAKAADLAGVTSYALRHSSIVRGLRAGLPIRLVASLHDTSTPMIERFYGRFIADGLEDLAARAVVSLTR